MVDLIGETLRKKINNNETILDTSKAAYWFGDKSSRSTKIQNSTSAIDKGLKAANFIPAFAAAVIEADGGSQEVVSGLRNISSDARNIRNGVGLWNAAQSIPRLIYRWQEFKVACMSLNLDKNRGLKIAEKDGIISMSLVQGVSTREKVLGVVSAGFKLLEWIAYNVCFVVCAPAQWLDKWFQLGPHAKTIGSQFGLMFLIKDIFLYSGVITNLAHKKCEFDRLHPLSQNLTDILVKTERSQSEQEAINSYIIACNDYRKEQYDAFITTIKSACDIALSIFNVAKVKVNNWVPLSLGLVSSMIGVWEIWRDTRPGPAGAKEGMPEMLKLKQEDLRH